jgi:prepilin-type N-terminal cleavage/methylation domain-containing protein
MRPGETILGPFNSKGFTLVEVAIVLLIAGLLLGGVLKASELILNARVRNLITELEGVQTAYLAFQDRYRARPGDYAAAHLNIKCPPPLPACLDGNGNGLIETLPPAPVSENLLAWTHLAASGLVQGNYTMLTATEATAAQNNSPHNPWGPFLNLVYSNRFGDGTASARHNLNSGDFIPVEVLAETDRKIDDGRANSGRFQLGWSSAVGTDPTVMGCTSTVGTVMSWDLLHPAGNCAGALILD